MQHSQKDDTYVSLANIIKSITEDRCPSVYIREIAQIRVLSEQGNYVIFHNRYSQQWNRIKRKSDGKVFNIPPSIFFPLWEPIEKEQTNYIGRVRKLLKMPKNLYYECLEHWNKWYNVEPMSVEEYFNGKIY